MLAKLLREMRSDWLTAVATATVFVVVFTLMLRAPYWTAGISIPVVAVLARLLWLSEERKRRRS
jgi:hypothetical protein